MYAFCRGSGLHRRDLGETAQDGWRLERISARMGVRICDHTGCGAAGAGPVRGDAADADNGDHVLEDCSDSAGSHLILPCAAARTRAVSNKIP